LIRERGLIDVRYPAPCALTLEIASGPKSANGHCPGLSVIRRRVCPFGAARLTSASVSVDFETSSKIIMGVNVESLMGAVSAADPP
jgi:hypothetical protein